MGQGGDRKDGNTRPLCKTRVLKKRVVRLKKGKGKFQEKAWIYFNVERVCQ